MGRKKICLVVNNPCHVDSRILKIAQSAISNGYDVVVVARAGNGLPMHELRQGVRIRRVAWQSPFKVLTGAILMMAGRTGAWAEARNDSINDQTNESSIASVPWALEPLKRLIGAHIRDVLIHCENLLACLPVLIREMPDICHANDLDTLWGAVALKRRIGCAVVYDSHEIAVEEYGDMTVSAKKWRAFQERRFIRDIDAVSVAWQGIDDYFERMYQLSADAVVFNTPIISENSNVASLRTRVGLPENERLAVLVGTVRRDRGIMVALEAIEILDGWSLACLGDCSAGMREEIDAFCRARGIREKVYLIDPVEPKDIVNVIADADASLLLNENTSLNFDQSMPNKLFESVLAGVPMVVGQLSAAKSFVVERGLGLSVDQTSGSAVADGLRQIANQPTRFRSDEGKLNDLRRAYAWPVQFDKLLGLYEQILKGRV